MTQVIEELTRGDGPCTYKQGKTIMKDVEVWDRLDCRDHGMVVFRILRRGSRTKSRIITLGFKRRDFGLFRDLIGRSSWERELERRKVQEV